MGKDRSRILALLVAYVALVVVSAIIMDWFVVSLPAGGETASIAIGLREVTVCQGGVCASVSFSGMALRGNYPLAAAVTFWSAMLLSVLVIYIAGTRIISEAMNESLSRTGSIGAIVVILGAGVTGFLFAPDGAAMGVAIARTWAPVLLIAAQIVGIVTLQLAARPDTEEVTAQPVGPRELPAMRARPRETGLNRLDAGAAAPQVPRERPPTGPVPTIPEHLRKQLRFATLGAEITRAGVDARREDGSTQLVLWPDVVGVVARGLPPEYGGATFVDVVSSAGATLRVLPWTRLTGDPVAGSGDDRARALISLVAASCPAIKLDAVTREFLEGRAPPRQLPDAQTLAAHDERLA